MITNLADYFTKGCGRCPRFDTADCSTKLWATGLAHLRRLCLDAGLTETLKWGHPCYTMAGRNVAILGTFRTDFRLNFFNPALMTDPAGILEKQGPNTQHAGMIRFTDPAQVKALEPTIIAYLVEAADYAQQGRTAPKTATDHTLPDELIDALDADPELAEAFNALTLGRQKSYVFALSTTQNPATRIIRITKFRDKILAGKAATDR
jgi:uncharacterized protein YdeI (YjbR/CyaY-like superfamily)